MELGFIAPGTRTRQYALKLAGLPEGTGPGTMPVDPAQMDDTLTAAVCVFDAYRVYSANAYFAYHTHETAQHPRCTVDRTTAARVTGDFCDDTPLLVDTFAITQLAALVSLEASGVADVTDIHLVVEHLRNDAPVPSADDIGDVTFVSETGIDVQSATSRH